MSRMVYERGRLVPIEHSERMQKASRAQGRVEGALCGIGWGVIVTLLAFAGPVWAILYTIVCLIVLAVASGGGGETSGKAGVMPGGHSLGG